MPKILIIDDNPLLLKYLCTKIRQAGYEVIHTNSGLQAAKLLETCSPDVIFIDYFLPNINGDKLCRIVRSMVHLAHTYLVIMSAAASELELDPESIGADALIAKGTFKETVKHCLATIAEATQAATLAPQKRIKGLDKVYSRQMTLELLAQNDHLQTMLDSIAEGILEIHQDRIVYANPTAVKLLGLPQEQLLTTSPAALFGPPGRAQLQSVLEGDEGSATSFNQDHTLTHRSRLLAIRKLPIPGDRETIILMLTDVTQRVKAEQALNEYRDHLEELVKQRTEELQQANETLWQSQKMEALGTLAGGMAHDFNNIMAGILGHISLIQAELTDDHPHAAHLSNVEGLISNASDLSGQLLALARGGATESVPTDLNRIILKQSQLFGRIKKEIVISVDIDPNLWVVEVDRGQIRQVLLNLFTNAWQAMPAGGRISVRSENKVVDDKMASTLNLETGRFACISVTDNGIGMTAETRRRIFDPFFSTKITGRGTGLGLASVYGIIRNFNGAVVVYSQPGRGATFQIFLPVSEKELRPDGTVKRHLRRGQGTILLVDDEEIILEVTAEMLRELGYQVIIAQSGSEAMEVYTRERARISLVLLDMIMPGMSGGKVLNKILAINPQAKVIVSSGYSADSFVERLISDGCIGFLQKPYSLNKLSHKLDAVLWPSSQPDKPKDGYHHATSVTGSFEGDHP